MPGDDRIGAGLDDDGGLVVKVVAEAGAAATVSSPAVAANKSAAMVRTGRMVISPRRARKLAVQHL